MEFSVEEIWPAEAFLGEGAVWSDFDAALYWVDIHAGMLHRCSAAGEDRFSWQLPEKIGCVIPDGQGRVICALKSGFARVTLEPGREVPELDWIARPEGELPGNRFNDGKRAPDGSIWAGTMHDDETETSGFWWRLGVDGQLSRLNQRPFKVTNGPAFDPGQGRVFVTDSAAQIVYAADLIENGQALGGLAVHLRFGEGDGYPDGMALDRSGHLWIAFWEGGCIRRFAPDGSLTCQVDLPVRRPTTVTFGSEGSMFVTSAGLGRGEPSGGALFRVQQR